MIDLKLFVVNDDYIEYLRANVSYHVFSNKEPNYKHTRKYLGVLIPVNEYNYYVPLSSPKESDYTCDENGKRIIRKSIIPIMRMVDTDANGDKKLLGTLKFSNMIPVPNEQLVKYDADNEMDSSYKNLVQKEIRFINRHTDEIIKNAAVLYKQKISNQKIKYLDSTLDFKALEVAHDKYSSR